MGRVPELIREIRKLPKFPGPLCTWEHLLSDYGMHWQSWDGKSNRLQICLVGHSAVHMFPISLGQLTLQSGSRYNVK